MTSMIICDRSIHIEYTLPKSLKSKVIGASKSLRRDGRREYYTLKNSCIDKTQCNRLTNYVCTLSTIAPHYYNKMRSLSYETDNHFTGLKHLKYISKVTKTLGMKEMDDLK